RHVEARARAIGPIHTTIWIALRSRPSHSASCFSVAATLPSRTVDVHFTIPPSGCGVVAPPEADDAAHAPNAAAARSVGWRCMMSSNCELGSTRDGDPVAPELQVLSASAP